MGHLKNILNDRRVPSKDMGLIDTPPGTPTHLQCFPEGWKGPKPMREAGGSILASVRLMLRRERPDSGDPWVLPGC